MANVSTGLRTLQIKVDGIWYAYTKNFSNGKTRFTKNYKDCSQQEWTSAYRKHKELSGVTA